MKSRQLIIPTALGACLATAGLAYIDNNDKTAKANGDLIAEATRAETKEELERQRQHYLDAVAKDVIAGKVPDVVFDSGGILQHAEYTKQLQEVQRFQVREPIEDKLRLSSVGIRNSVSGEYAAIAILDKKLTIMAVFTKPEVQAKIDQIQKQQQQR